MSVNTSKHNTTRPVQMTKQSRIERVALAKANVDPGGAGKCKLATYASV